LRLPKMYHLTAAADGGKKEKQALSIDQAIERLGMGRFQQRILRAAGLSSKKTILYLL